jgi:hypothetical protein
VIVWTGQTYLLGLQVTDMSHWLWGLFVNNYAPALNDGIAQYQEPTFSGYNRQVMGNMSSVNLINRKASVVPATLPSWTNAAATPATVYGWVLLAADGVRLLAAANFGPQLLQPGQLYSLSALVTLNTE